MRRAVSPRFCFVFILERILFRTDNLSTIVIMEADKRYYALFCLASYGFFEETRPLLSNVDACAVKLPQLKLIYVLNLILLAIQRLQTGTTAASLAV